jgi:ATP-dependent DNA ligase
LRERPLEERRGALAEIIRSKPPILLSEEFAGDGAAIFKIACENELEGIVSKRIDRTYIPRGHRFVCQKCGCQEFGVFADWKEYYEVCERERQEKIKLEYPQPDIK